MARSVAGGPDSLARLRADLARLGAHAQQLQAAVATAADLADQLNPPGGPAAGPPPGGAPTWVDIEPDQAPAVLVDLARWIAAVLGYHRVAEQLHPCWYRHPGLVQALLDVRVAWLAAYRDPAGGRVPAALDWWQRHLPQLDRQVRELLDRCSSGRHEPAGLPPRVGGESTLRGYALWWAADRNPATEPPSPAPAPGPPDPEAAGGHGVPRPREAPGTRPADRPATEPGAA